MANCGPPYSRGSGCCKCCPPETCPGRVVYSYSATKSNCSSSSSSSSSLCISDIYSEDCERFLPCCFTVDITSECAGLDGQILYMQYNFASGDWECDLTMFSTGWQLGGYMFWDAINQELALRTSGICPDSTDFEGYPGVAQQSPECGPPITFDFGCGFVSFPTVPPSSECLDCSGVEICFFVTEYPGECPGDIEFVTEYPGECPGDIETECCTVASTLYFQPRNDFDCACYDSADAFALTYTVSTSPPGGFPSFDDPFHWWGSGTVCGRTLYVGFDCDGTEGELKIFRVQWRYSDSCAIFGTYTAAAESCDPLIFNGAAALSADTCGCVGGAFVAGWEFTISD